MGLNIRCARAIKVNSTSFSSLILVQVKLTREIQDMAAAVAGEILGPRPGRAICSFWQGGMEMALRIIAPVVRIT